MLLIGSLSSNPKKIWSFLKTIGGGHLNEIISLPGETWVNHLSAVNQSDPSQVYGDMTHVNNIKNSVNALLTNSDREPYRDLLNDPLGKK